MMVEKAEPNENFRTNQNLFFSLFEFKILLKGNNEEKVILKTHFV
jgi:hypothetical protein